MGILDKISEIEKEISRTQKNKGKCNEDEISYFVICGPFIFRYKYPKYE